MFLLYLNQSSELTVETWRMLTKRLMLRYKAEIMCLVYFKKYDMLETEFHSVALLEKN